jgi:hypothetical protein
MSFLEVIGQAFLRLGTFFLTTFVSVAMGVLAYILTTEWLDLLPKVGNDPSALWTITEVLILISCGMVALLCACIAIGVFVWGFFQIFSFD